MSLDRIQALRKSLHDHNFRYYISDNPIISDFDFDKLLSELSELEQKYPDAFDPNSPTQRVGGEIVKSFDSVFTQIDNFLCKINFLIQRYSLNFTLTEVVV